MSYRPPNSSRNQFTPPIPGPPKQVQGKGISIQDLANGIKQINVSHPKASVVFREQILINLLLAYINNPNLNLMIWQQGFGDAFSDFNRMSVGQKPINHQE